MAAIIVSITDAKCRLPELLAEAEAGKEVILTRWGKPVIRLALTCPVEAPRPQSRPGRRSYR